MTRPGGYWQLVGPKWNAYDLAVADWLNGSSRLIVPGPGNRIEYIGPFTQYNWAEGSRAIEARRGAAKMREYAYLTWLARKIEVELQLLTILRQLGA